MVRDFLDALSLIELPLTSLLLRALGWAVAAMLVLLVAPVPTATAKKFQVVVFGDSYGSGEGAPATNGDYGADGGALRNQGVLGIINEGSRPLPTPAADWNCCQSTSAACTSSYRPRACTS